LPFLLRRLLRHAAGNSSQATFDVTVVDATPPVLTLIGADPLVHPAGTPFTDPGATATDAVDGSVPVTQTANTVDPAIPGSYVVTYEATDAAGNTATVSRTVTVEGGSDDDDSSDDSSSDDSSSDDDSKDDDSKDSVPEDDDSGKKAKPKPRRRWRWRFWR
tara:strand:+ start:59 stop:541 length:483 start_codon:yes stop_codon:yes gene_type:complete